MLVDSIGKLGSVVLCADHNEQMFLVMINEEMASDWFPFSTPAAEIMDAFAKNGYHHLRLDWDVDAIEGLPTFPLEDAE